MSPMTQATVAAALPVNLRAMSDMLKELQVKGQWVLVSPSGAVYATDTANDMVKLLIPHTDIGRIA